MHALVAAAVGPIQRPPVHTKRTSHFQPPLPLAAIETLSIEQRPQLPCAARRTRKFGPWKDVTRQDMMA